MEEYDFIMSCDHVDFVCRFCEDDEPMIPEVCTKNCIDKIIEENITRINDEIEVLRYTRDEIRNLQLTNEVALLKNDLAEISEELHGIARSPPTKLHHEENDNPDVPTSLLSIYTHNMGGMKNKSDSIHNHLISSDFDVYAFQETWYDSTVPDGVVNAHTNFQEWRQDRKNKSGGGVAMYTKFNLNASRPFIELEDKLDGIECLTLRLENVWITNIYVPPGVKVYYERLHSYLSNVAKKTEDSTWIMIGDLNRAYIEWRPMGVEAADQSTEIQPKCRTGIGVSTPSLGQGRFGHFIVKSKFINELSFSILPYLDSMTDVVDLELITERLKEIHKASSNIPKKESVPQCAVRHPFLRFNNQYWDAVKIKRDLASKYKRNPDNEELREFYNRACRVVYQLYEQAKNFRLCVYIYIHIKEMKIALRKFFLVEADVENDIIN